MAIASVQIHPNYSDRVVLVDGQPYYWDGDVCSYRRGYGAYATTTMIGEWQSADAATAARIRREVAGDAV